MARLIWDADGARKFHAGVSHGVVYPKADGTGYDKGAAWNGLTGVTESPSGAEPNDLWADNQKYARLISGEDYGFTIEAYQERRLDFGKKVSDVTINNYLRNMSAFFNWCVEEELILRSPIKRGDYIKVDRRPLEFVSDEDFHRLLLNLNTASFSEYRDSIIIQLLLDTGMRIRECLLIQVTDVDLPKRCMLDTGIDVPEVLNLVFFKKVLSKAKFWQMIGRGTRLCPGLLDGENKTKFYIFDFCGNFEFFRMNKGKATPNMIALQGAIFGLQFEMAYKLQDMQYQTDELKAFRTSLVEHMAGQVQQLNRENFAVRQHLRYVELYADKASYDALTFADTLIAREELAPVIEPEPDDPKALRFDALLYGIELAQLAGKNYNRGRSELLKKAKAVAKVSNIPAVDQKRDLLEKIIQTDYIKTADTSGFEHIRKELRDLIKYIPVGHAQYYTDFTDDILSVEWKEAELENDDLKNYKAKAEYYVRQHQDNAVIAKLKSNIPLDAEDIKELEKILWSEVGTKEDYEAEYGTKPLGEFVREIVGLDMAAAKAAFSQYLDGANLDSRQIYFVNQIVEYIVQNGMMKDLSVLQEPPFTDQGSIVEVFTDLSVWLNIRKTIEQVNANAAA